MFTKPSLFVLASPCLLTPERYGNNFTSVFFKLILGILPSWIFFIFSSTLVLTPSIDVVFELSMSISCLIGIRWVPQNPINGMSTLVQVMACCRQATSYYLSQCWPTFMSLYGISRPQWVDVLTALTISWSDFHHFQQIWKIWEGKYKWYHMFSVILTWQICYLNDSTALWRRKTVSIWLCYSDKL